ncbi:MAG: S-methyl-5-thioribose-1-phosphate isomerase [Actinobacteria bacterium]|nr:S-methyl-5-thioribose-1-phosphate isomerase [Actinomycetota bacterium]
MRTVDWVDGGVRLVDQTRLPQDLVWLDVRDVATLVDAIKRLAVRGAPAIGVAGAFGIAIAYSEADPKADRTRFDDLVGDIREARPTAVNLARQVDRVNAVVDQGYDAVLAEAKLIRDEELAASIAMGNRGADLIESLVERRPIRAMTVCNTGGLAAVERGTALAVVQTLHERGILEVVLPLETRPLLQGARLTAWELQQMGAPHELIVDSAGPALLGRGEVDVVLAGADRIALNGDSANKIGTFSLSLGADYAGVPFLIVAPESTIDQNTASGDDIEIEQRDASEVIGFRDTKFAPDNTPCRNPAFDVTPARLITAIVTDTRIIDTSHGETAALRET